MGRKQTDIDIELRPRTFTTSCRCDIKTVATLFRFFREQMNLTARTKADLITWTMEYTRNIVIKMYPELEVTTLDEAFQVLDHLLKPANIQTRILEEQAKKALELQGEDLVDAVQKLLSETPAT